MTQLEFFILLEKSVCLFNYYLFIHPFIYFEGIDGSALVPGEKII